MKRLFLILLALAGCALDDPETSTDEAALSGGDSFEIEGGSISGSIHRGTDVSTASGGAYLSLDGPGYVRYFFDASSVRVFWARVRGAGAMDVSLDGVLLRHVTSATTDWTWIGLGATSLNTYQHTFRIDVVTPGLQVDRVLDKMDMTGTSFTPVTQFYDAESASLVFPMRTGFQSLPPTTYVWAPTGSGTTGQLDLDVAVPWYTGGGYYQVWVRANAQSDAHNTLMFGQDGSTTATFNAPLTSMLGYTWSRAYSFTIDSTDRAILSVRDSESGVKIDKFLITNDTGFQLVESSPPPVNSL